MQNRKRNTAIEFKSAGSVAAPELKTFSLELKDLSEDGSFTGYASVFGNKDLDDDIVVKGAFADSLLKNGGKVPVLWQHDVKQPIGANLEATEDDHGLFVKGQLVLEVEQAREAYALMKSGVIKGLSIGYRVIDFGYQAGARLLRKLELMEYSLVTFPANPIATVTAVKGVAPYHCLAVTDRGRGWDAAAARGRIVQWAQDAEGNIDTAKLQKCFLVFDEENPLDVNSYKLPIGEPVNGTPVVFPKALYAAADELKAMESDDRVEALKYHVARYYRKLHEEPPFAKVEAKQNGTDKEKKESFDPAGEVPAAAGEPKEGGSFPMDFDTTLARQKQKADHRTEGRRISDAHESAMQSVYAHPTMSPEDKKSAIATNYQQMCKAMTDWHCKNIDLGTKDDPSDYSMSSYGRMGTEPAESKSGRTISKATAAKLKAAQDLIDSGVELVKSGADSIKSMGFSVEANTSLPGSTQNQGNEDVNVNNPAAPKAAPTPEEEKAELAKAFKAGAGAETK